jgi:hypothetical protein
MMMSQKLCNAQLAEPVRHQQNMLGKVVVVQGRVGIALPTLAHDQRTEYSVNSLETLPEGNIKNLK